MNPQVGKRIAAEAGLRVIGSAHQGDDAPSPWLNGQAQSEKRTQSVYRIRAGISERTLFEMGPREPTIPMMRFNPGGERGHELSKEFLRGRVGESSVRVEQARSTADACLWLGHDRHIDEGE